MLTRALVALVLVVAMSGGFTPAAYRERPPRFADEIAETVKGTPQRGASRDRRRHGKARVRARRAAA